jgi:gamma-glutamyltranspeptidase/glutathione hydrolase
MALAAQTGFTPHGESTRPPATGRRGMVASGSQHATIAGLRALQADGNAVDAAVAVAAGLNVAEPFMSGMGGVGIALVHIPPTSPLDKGDLKASTPVSPLDKGGLQGITRTINYSGHAPNDIDPSSMTREDMDYGPLSMLVPGNIGGWLMMHDEYGTLPRAQVFEYAIDLAENGVPMTPLMATTITDSIDKIDELTEEGATPPLEFTAAGAGALLRQQQLAESMRRVVEGGLVEFYEGSLGDEICDGQKAFDGVINRDELAAYRPYWEEPLSSTYRDYEIRVPAPNSSAFQMLETLNILEGYELEPGTAATQHLLVEAVLKAADDRTRYSGDPKHVDIPLDRLLSKEYAEELRASISASKFGGFPAERWNRSAVEASLPGIWNPLSAAQSPMTTHFATADQWGNVVTVTQTLGGGFGSCHAPKGTGVFINNMGKWFDLNQGSPNDLAGGRAVDFVIAPSQIYSSSDSGSSTNEGNVEGKGDFLASIGTPGSYGILHTTIQMIHQFLDCGKNIQEAIEAPRFRYYDMGALMFESRFDAEMLEQLGDIGYRYDLLPPYTNAVGGAHAIHRTSHGTYLGAADPRRDGFALGY